MRRAIDIILSYRYMLFGWEVPSVAVIAAVLAAGVIAAAVYACFTTQRGRARAKGALLIFTAFYAAVMCIVLFAMLHSRYVDEDELMHRYMIYKLHPVFLWDIQSGDILYDIAVNILLFVPLGAALYFLSGVRYRAVRVVISVSVCVAVSITAEILQLFLPYRITDISDVLRNFDGAAAGALLALAADAAHTLYLKIKKPYLFVRYGRM